jgi:hypothetical protein
MDIKHLEDTRNSYFFNFLQSVVVYQSDGRPNLCGEGDISAT